MKEKIAEWLKNALTFQASWTYEGEGHWAPPRRRVRSWVKALCGAGAAALLVLAWRFPDKDSVETPELRTGPEVKLETKNPASQPLQSPETPALSEPNRPNEGPRLIAVAPLEPFSQDLPLSAAGEEGANAEPKPSGGKLLTFVPAEVEISLIDEPASEIPPEPQDDEPAAVEPKTGPAPRPGKSVPSWQRPYWIRVSKGDYTLSLYRGKDLVKTYSVAVGQNPGNKRAIGDHRTPVGDFRVVSIEDASKWKHDFGDGKGKIAGAYGPWFIRLDAGGWKGIGIHGTHDPDSRGTMATEGCIRLSNEEISDLRRYAHRNMRVVIEE